MGKTKILLVEDEAALRASLQEELAAKDFEVESLSDGHFFLNRLAEFSPNIVIMDELLPGLQGHQLVNAMREKSEFNRVGVLMLTAVTALEQKVAALESGADDYVTKPFSFAEVVARLRALQRRIHPAVSSLVNKENLRNKYGPFKVDSHRHRAWCQNEELGLTLTEFRIFSELISGEGRVISRDELRERTLDNAHLTDRTLDVHMAALRKKLGVHGSMIETVRGVGYRLIERTSQ